MILFVPLAMIVAGLVLHMAVSLVYGVRGPERGDWNYTVLRVLSWVGVGGGLFAWCVVLVGGSLMAISFGLRGGIGTFLAIAGCSIVWITVGFAIVDAVRSSRGMHRRLNAKLLAIAEREGQLTQAGELLAELRSGWIVGDAAMGLAHDLARGVPLYESVARHRTALPNIGPAYAAVGTLAHAEPEALDEVSQPEDAALAAAWRNWGDYLAYGLAMWIAMGLLLTYFCVNFIPAFEQIFSEFALDLPTVTHLVVGLASWGTGIGWLLILLLLGLLLGLLALGIMYLFDLPFLSRLTDRVFLRGHLAHVLRMVALGVEHRVELPRLFYALSVTYPVASIRGRLASCYTDAEIGRALPGLMEMHGLVTRSEMGLVETAMKVGNLPWALRQIAARKESQMAARMTVTSRVAYPLIVLGIGLVVAIIVISLFVPLVTLVEELSS